MRAQPDLTGKAIAVFCGARPVATDYLDLARDLGAALAASGATLIYGAGMRGLMGAVSSGALARQGRVIGVIPSFMRELGWESELSAEVVVTTNMHDRKEWMESHADGFIVLPGGLGTLDELVTVMTTRQLRQHAKPIVVLDPTDYYQPLWRLFRRMVAHDFVDPLATPMPLRAATPAAALVTLAAALHGD